jgi:phosphoribosylanthranilate isomerase
MGAKKNIAIKICGMRDHENIMDVATLSPQYFGFIFYAKSPRFVGEEFLLPENFPRVIKKVGVFVNEENATILLKAKKLGLDLIQLHGNESVAQAEELKASGLGVIKVFSVHDEFGFKETTTFRKAVDYFLFDTKGKFYGGNAEAFNWDILRKYDQETPFFLSGGLSPENVHNVNDILSMNIHALDLNSGVEFSPGLKSLEKIKNIKQIATNFELR